MEKEFLVKINSNATGKHCDLYPAMAVFRVKHSENGLEVVTRNASWIPRTFDVFELTDDTPLKKCPNCSLEFTRDTEFIDTRQKGIGELCVTCYERMFIGGDKYAYKASLRRQIMAEFNLTDKKD